MVFLRPELGVIEKYFAPCGGFAGRMILRKLNGTEVR